MITHVGTAMLYVSDQQASLAFYRDTLGFAVVSDADMERQPWGTFAFIDGPDGHRVQIHEK